MPGAVIAVMPDVDKSGYLKGVVLNIWLPTIRGGSGSDVYTELLAAGLRNRGHKVEVTWFNTFYQFAPFLLAGVKAPSGTDIIHTNCNSGIAFRSHGIPLVVTEHHCIYDPVTRPFKSIAQNIYHQLLVKRYTKSSLASSGGVVAVSNYTLSGLRREFGVMNARVIYNWVDTDKFKPVAESTHRNDRFQLLFVGNMTRRKGADLLGPIMRDLGSGFELRCVTGLRKLPFRSSDENIISLGSLSGEALVRAYQDSDALLFPTRFEGLGYVALEAMACGKPVIASNNSALPEVVEHGVNGLLCETGNVHEFANACRRLAEDKPMCRRLGEAARVRVEERFCVSVIMPQYEAFYRSALELLRQ